LSEEQDINHHNSQSNLEDCDRPAVQVLQMVRLQRLFRFWEYSG